MPNIGIVVHLTLIVDGPDPQVKQPFSLAPYALLSLTSTCIPFRFQPSFFHSLLWGIKWKLLLIHYYFG